MFGRILLLLSPDRAHMEQLADEMANRVRALPPEQVAAYARTPLVQRMERDGGSYWVEVRVEPIPGTSRRGVAIRVRRGRFPWTTLTSYIPVNL